MDGDLNNNEQMNGNDEIDDNSQTNNGIVEIDDNEEIDNNKIKKQKITNIEKYHILKNIFNKEFGKINDYLIDTCGFKDNDKIEELKEKFYTILIKNTNTNLSNSTVKINLYTTNLLKVIECLYKRYKSGSFSWLFPNPALLNKRINQLITNISNSRRLIQKKEIEEICSEIIEKIKGGKKTKNGKKITSKRKTKNGKKITNKRKTNKRTTNKRKN